MSHEDTVPHSRTRFTEEEAQAVADIVRSGIIDDSITTRTFEQQVARLLGLAHAWACSTGTLALSHALRLVGVGKNDEVLVSTYVCNDVLSAIHMLGARCVPVDIGPDLNLNPEALGEKVSPQTRAIVVVHLFGLLVDSDPLRAHSLPLVHDICHALGSDGLSKMIADEDLAILSFQALKMLTTGEGGMILTSNREIAALADRYRSPDFAQGSFAATYHLSNLQAGLGLAQLQRFPDRLRRRRTIALRYFDSLVHLPGVTCIGSRQQWEAGSCYRFIVRVTGNHRYEQIEAAFQEAGIVVRRPVKSLLHRHLEMPLNGFSNAEKAIAQIISLPCYPALGDDEQDKVIAACIRIFSNNLVL